MRNCRLGSGNVGRCLAVGIALGWLTSAAAGLAAEPGIGEVVLQSRELPKGWGFVKSVYSVSESASDLYENYEQSYQDTAGARLVSKQFQSLLAGANRGTIFYLDLEGPAQAAKVVEFAKRLVLEGGAPSQVHPERIFAVGGTVVMISIADPAMADQVEKLLRSRPAGP
jgi:hypothetical protein